MSKKSDKIAQVRDVGLMAQWAFLLAAFQLAQVDPRDQFLSKKRQQSGPAPRLRKDCFNLER